MNMAGVQIEGKSLEEVKQMVIETVKEMKADKSI